MKLRNYFGWLAVALCAGACSSDDDKVNLAENVAGIYNGYTTASLWNGGYSLSVADEKVTMTSNPDGSLRVAYTSETWGSFVVSDATITQVGSNYQIGGSGNVEMTSHGTGSTASYPFTVEGTASEDKSSVVFQFSIPSLMGGTFITFHAGDMPAHLFVAGEYEGTVEVTAFGSMAMDPLEGQTVRIASNEDGTVKVTYAGTQWGTATISKATVTREADGTYAIAGEGKVVTTSMGSDEEVEYNASLTGVMNADKTEVSFTFSYGYMQLVLVFNNGSSEE